MSVYSQQGIPCTWMRGGTSKGAYFLKSDLPDDPNLRDQLLLSVMGSPDARQIDGIGGADPLCSKVAIVSRSDRQDADIDFLFLQVFVDQALVSDAQNCGNILSGVGQFALEQSLISTTADTTEVAVYMENSQQVAELTLQTPKGAVTYAGDTAIDGVPGTAAQVLQNFPQAAGSSCGALLPSGSVVDVIDGIEVTCIDNGMPVVVLRASDMGISGYETREALDADQALKAKLESIRLQVGELMNLGNVKDKSVPKMTMVAAPVAGGVVCTRTFIPHRCHASIGVLGAVSVATACLLKGSPANAVAQLPSDNDDILLAVEHPIGQAGVMMRASGNDAGIHIEKAAVVRTARKLFAGRVYPSVEPR
ncbi:MAG: 4-oxalomesaconate tautomerase [Pseudomonadota bacterium]